MAMKQKNRMRTVGSGIVDRHLNSLTAVNVWVRVILAGLE